MSDQDSQSIMDMTTGQLEKQLAQAAQAQRRTRISANVEGFAVSIEGKGFEILEVEGTVRVTVLSAAHSCKYSITGCGHEVSMDNGELCIKPTAQPAEGVIKYAWNTGTRYSTEQLLRLRHVDELVESNENALRDAGIKKSDEERAASTWRLSLPFTNPELKRRDSYLVPQLLAINIRPVLEGSVHRLPRTVIVASTNQRLGPS
jgi:hypothetical protein